MSNDKADGLARARSMESNNQTRGGSAAPFERKPGPAYGGSTKGNPTKDGEIPTKE